MDKQCNRENPKCEERNLRLVVDNGPVRRKATAANGYRNELVPEIDNDALTKMLMEVLDA